jgi:tRNA U55 pseudouridine synthase TruB
MQGESLHHKARRGETVTLQPRTVTFHKLTLLAFEPPDRVCLHVACSAGAYVRSLAHDLGQALNGYAHLDILRRESAGPFTLTDAYTLEQIEEAIQEQRFDTLLLPPGARLELPRLTVDQELLTRLGHGQKTPIALTSSMLTESVQPFSAVQTNARQQSPLASLVRVYSVAGEFAGIVRCLGPAESIGADSGADATYPVYIWKAEKWFLGAG